MQACHAETCQSRDLDVENIDDWDLENVDWENFTPEDWQNVIVSREKVELSQEAIAKPLQPDAWLSVSPAPFPSNGNAQLPDEGPPLQRRWPVFVFCQLCLTVVPWLIFSILHDTPEAGLESLWPRRTDLIVQEDCQDRRHEVWRWFSYQFTHIGFNHVVINAALMLALGIPLERFHGTGRVAFIFNAGVFGGACGYFVADNHSRTVGMSGGCYGLLGMHMANITINHCGQRAFCASQLALLGLLCTVDILQATVLNEFEQTSHAAHGGGFVAGLMACAVVGRRVSSRDTDCCVRALTLIMALGLTICCVCWGMSWAPQNIFEEVRWCWGKQIVSSSVFGDGEPHCVRCDSHECIAKWAPMLIIGDASHGQCARLGGWAFSGR